jgi:flagellar biosynthesis protein FlhG
MSLTLVTPRRARAFSIAVTSGKGGVGKTSVAIHLAAALAGLRRRVALVDADFALGNIDVRLGLTPTRHLGAVLDGECGIDEITVAGPLDLDVVPAASGVRALAALSPVQWRRFGAALEQLAEDRDFIVIDTATGVADAVMDVVGLADYALVVTTDEPAALVDAYATIKLLTEADAAKPVGVLVNAVKDEDAAGRVAQQLTRAARRFLSRTVRDDGYVLADASLRDAAFRHALATDLVAASAAGRCFRRLAARLAALAVTPPGSGPAPALVAPRVPSFVEAPRCA